MPPPCKAVTVNQYVTQAVSATQCTTKLTTYTPDSTRSMSCHHTEKML